jgi:hypothetical protein
MRKSMSVLNKNKSSNQLETPELLQAVVKLEEYMIEHYGDDALLFETERRFAGHISDLNCQLETDETDVNLPRNDSGRNNNSEANPPATDRDDAATQPSAATASNKKRKGTDQQEENPTVGQKKKKIKPPDRISDSSSVSASSDDSDHEERSSGSSDEHSEDINVDASGEDSA